MPISSVGMFKPPSTWIYIALSQRSSLRGKIIRSPEIVYVLFGFVFLGHPQIG